MSMVEQAEVGPWRGQREVEQCIVATACGISRRWCCRSSQVFHGGRGVASIRGRPPAPRSDVGFTRVPGAGINIVNERAR